MKGRIPQYFIDDLLSRVDITDVIDRRVPLKKTGRNYVACCPFHDEKTPSFSVSQEKQFFHCFGCQVSGNAIGFLMEYERLEFPQAVEALATAAGMEVPREQMSDRERAQQQRRRDLYGLMEAIADWYREQLTANPEARRYLDGRGLSSEICQRFGIGYAPDSYEAVLRQFGKDEATRRQLQEAGMVIARDDGRLYDRFRGRIMFPIRDSRGRCIAFGGRVLGDAKPKYLNSPETPIFSKGRELYGFYEARRELRSIQRLMFTEGYMDVVALAQFGIPWAVATLGTATSDVHLKQAFRHTPEVVFCFDGDRAGRAAALKALDVVLPLMEDGRSARFLFLPTGEDPDSLVRDIGSDRFTALANNATPLEDYLFESLGPEANAGSLSAKALLSKQAAPLVGRLPDGVFKRLMLDELARRADVSRDVLNAVMAEQPPPEASPAEPPPQRRPIAVDAAVSPRNPLLLALSCLLKFPNLAEEVRRAALPQMLAEPAGEALVGVANLILEQADTPSTATLLGLLIGRPEKPLADSALGLEQSASDEATAAKILGDTLSHFRRQLEEQSLSSAVDKLRNADYAEISKEEIAELQRQLANKHKTPG